MMSHTIELPVEKPSRFRDTEAWRVVVDPDTGY
jgi:hypothetical protein